VREVEGENPLRVVLDPDGRLGAERRVFQEKEARTLVVRRAQRRASDAPDPGRAPDGIIALPVRGSDGFEPAAVLDALRARGCRRVLVEGGGITVSRFLQAGVLNRLHLT